MPAPSTPATARSRAAAVGVARAADLVVRHGARGGERVQPGQRLQRACATKTGTSPSSSTETRSAAWAIASPAPDRTSSSVEADPASTALAWAPRSSDSVVSSGEVRRSPRSRSIVSIPSRVAAKADADALEPARHPSRRSTPGTVVTSGAASGRVASDPMSETST